MIFARNPNYCQPDKPLIDQVIVRIVPDATERKTMLLEGDADVDVWATEPVVYDLQDKPNVQVSVSPYSRWVLRLFFNLAAKGSVDPVASPHPILSDVRVRQAIRMAIDVDTISK
jgi:ABC-type transport system substrate-binding protein